MSKAGDFFCTSCVGVERKGKGEEQLGIFRKSTNNLLSIENTL